MDEGSPNLVCALILWRSSLGLLMGRFHQFVQLSTCHRIVAVYFFYLQSIFICPPPTGWGIYFFCCRSSWCWRDTFLSAQYLVNQWLDSYQICRDI